MGWGTVEHKGKGNRAKSGLLHAFGNKRVLVYRVLC